MWVRPSESKGFLSPPIEKVKAAVYWTVRWRVALQWYAVAILPPIVFLSASTGVYSLFGGSTPIRRLSPPDGAVAYFIISIPFMLLTEETAWRGFALSCCQVKYPALTASLIVGILWDIWHTPLFLIQGTPQSTYPYVAFVLLTVAQSVLAVWIFNNTGGSVVLAAVFHVATNLTWSYMGIGVAAGGLIKSVRTRFLHTFCRGRRRRGPRRSRVDSDSTLRRRLPSAHLQVGTGRPRRSGPVCSSERTGGARSR